MMMARSDAGRMSATERWERRVERGQRHDRDVQRERAVARELEQQGEGEGAVVLTMRPRTRHVDRGWAA